VPCIYCLRSTEGRSPRAHIFSESIFGDGEELVLANGEVCGACNNRLAKLESQFKEHLGLIPLMLGPGVNKRGRPTTINAPGLSGTRDPRDPRISVNLGKQPWTSSDGRHVRPALKSGEKVEFEPTGQGPDGYRFRLRHEMRVDAVFIRILAKIGFETICLHRGAYYCADVRWHRVRSFILHGEGDRTYFMPNSLTMPVRPDGGVSVPVGITLVPVEVRRSGKRMEEWLAAIRVGPSFIIDVSTENDVLPDLLETMPVEVREAGFLKTCHGKRTVQPA
jgi:hypothetical protein